MYWVWSPALPIPRINYWIVVGQIWATPHSIEGAKVAPEGKWGCHMKKDIRVRPAINRGVLHKSYTMQGVCRPLEAWWYIQGLKVRDLAVTGNASAEHRSGGGALLLLSCLFSAPHLFQQVLVGCPEISKYVLINKSLWNRSNQRTQ